MPSPTLSLILTWTPAETGITEIASYSIMRSVDGAPQTLLINCPVLRDFLGGIIGVENCTTTPSIPSDDDSGNVYDKVTVEDAPVTYIDTSISLGHDYCYQIVATPMGNNQSVAQGPPVSSNIACSTSSLEAPQLSASYDSGGHGIVLLWGLAAGNFLDVTGWSVYRSVNSGPYTLLVTEGASVLSYEDSAVSSGNTYSYYVTASALSVTSPQSIAVSVAVP